MGGEKREGREEDITITCAIFSILSPLFWGGTLWEVEGRKEEGFACTRTWTLADVTIQNPPTAISTLRTLRRFRCC